jgi:hypothetical protein
MGGRMFQPPCQRGNDFLNFLIPNARQKYGHWQTHYFGKFFLKKSFAADPIQFLLTLRGKSATRIT